MFQGVCSPVLCCAGVIPCCKGPGRIVCVCVSVWGGVHILMCMYTCVGAWANTQAPVYLGHMLVYMSTLIRLVISRCCGKKHQTEAPKGREFIVPHGLRVSLTMGESMVVTVALTVMAGA